MVPHYDLAVLLVGILGLAFLLVWVGDRLNTAALLWGTGHLCLSLAIFVGYRYMLGQGTWMGGVSLVATAVFLVTLQAANRSLLGRRTNFGVLAWQTSAVAVVVGIAGFVVNELAGRLLVSLLMFATYLWSAQVFVRHRQQFWVGAVFALKAVTLMTPVVAEPQAFSTPQQSISYSSINWASSLLLALTLVYVAVQQSRRRLRQVLRHLPDALVARNIDGIVLFCNEQFARLAGAAAPEQLVGRPVPLLSDDTQEATAISRKITEIARSGPIAEPLVLERTIHPAKGETFPAEVLVSTFEDLGQTVVLAQIRDLSERRKAEGERLRLATTDVITGLPNRRHMEQLLATVLWECQRHQTQCAVLLIDLDHFKNVNDTMGHAQGDTVIGETARLLQAQCHARDVLGRIGGDEFVLVLTDLQPGMGTLALEERARGLCQLLAREVRHGSLRVMLGASIGIALSGPNGSTPAALLQHAEVAMYQAKARGRGEWCLFDQDMDERLSGLLLLESGLRQALQQDDELHLAYQPIVAAQGGTLAKVEALLRWNSPALGAVSPARFIPIAEQSTLILGLGEWVMRQAIRQAAAWSRESPNAPVVSINVSARQFMHPDFEGLLFRTLGEFALPPSKIELELTETLFASDGTELSALLLRLHDAGIGLALDDFGTGYSSLSYLSRFNLSTVKIDRSFIAQMEDSARARALVRAIIAMGHSLGLRVVAEGVETDAQRALLVGEGCDYLQGYLLGRPASADAIRLSPVAGSPSQT